MPNAKVLSEKQAIVAALVERIQGASAGLLIDYKGITVAEDTELRANLRNCGANYTVVKNTLTKLAIDQVGMNELDSVLNGTTALATVADDPIPTIRTITEFANKAKGEYFTVKAAFMDGKIITLEELAPIAELSTKEELYAKVLGTLLAPITSLAVCLGQILEQQGGSVAAPEAEAAAE